MRASTSSERERPLSAACRSISARALSERRVVSDVRPGVNFAAGPGFRFAGLPVMPSPRSYLIVT